MRDLTIALENRPGALAEVGEALQRGGVSVEGGGAFVVNNQGVAHFLVQDGAAARRALESAGIRVLEEREVLVQRLIQSEPGQLGKISRRIAQAGVNIEALYSDHEQQLILVVDDIAAAKPVSEAWMREREQTAKQRSYEVHVEWTGSRGEGTRSYRNYGREHTILSSGKPPIPGSSDPAFRGDATRYNPEELLVASLSACHMLWYLHLCAVNRVTVVGYHDEGRGLLREDAGGSGEFVRVLLRPRVRIAPGMDRKRAIELHEEAHRCCFIAKSVNFPVEIIPEVFET